MRSYRKPEQRPTNSLLPVMLIGAVALLVCGVCLIAFEFGNALSRGAAPQPEATAPAVPPIVAPSVPPIGVPTAGRVAPGAQGPLPDMPNKPKLASSTFKGCPPEGDGGDTILNRLKNRVDEGNYVPVRFDDALKLTWPPGIERRERREWSASETASIARYEGIPIAVEGFLAEAREQGPESTNCHGADSEFKDYHIWLTRNAGEDRTGSIVVEATPRLRAIHPAWRVEALNRVARDRQPVRISGWLMMDQEHPDQIGKTRGTIWEIHPILKIEVNQAGLWVNLDSLR